VSINIVYRYAGRIVAVLTVFTSGMVAAQDVPDRKPMMMRSIAEPVLPSTVRDGAHFRRVDKLFAAVAKGNDAALGKAAIPGAKLKLTSFEDGKLSSQAFTGAVIRAAMASCVGPLSVDEGRAWVQLSWVCDTSAGTLLSRLFKFRESPELSLTVFFKNDLIESIDAIEPLSLPGAKRVTMDAYSTMKQER